MCRLSIGYWLQTFVKYCIMQTLLVLKKTSFLKHKNEQIMPELLQSQLSVCGLYTIYAFFRLFKFRKEEITGVHDVNVLSFISNYMCFFGWSLHNWCCWKEYLKWILFLSNKKWIVLKYPYFRSFSSDYVPTLDNETFLLSTHNTVKCRVSIG